MRIFKANKKEGLTRCYRTANTRVKCPFTLFLMEPWCCYLHRQSDRFQELHVMCAFFIHVHGIIDYT